MTVGHNGGPPVGGRFIIYHVEWLDHPLVGRANPLYAYYWLDLICSCNYCDGSIRVNGFHFELKPGQMVGATSFLASRWKTTPSKVKTFLQHLASYGLITSSNPGQQDRQQKGKAPRVLSINYYSDLGMGQQVEPASKIASSVAKGSPRDRQQIASRSPELNKETNKQITTATRLTGLELDRYEAQLLESCNGALDNPANCLGLANLAVPLMWLDQGADIERDVIPTLRAVGKRDHGKRVRSWDYFTNAVMETKQRRERGIAEPITRRTDNQIKGEKFREGMMKYINGEVE